MEFVNAAANGRVLNHFSWVHLSLVIPFSPACPDQPLVSPFWEHSKAMSVQLDLKLLADLLTVNSSYLNASWISGASFSKFHISCNSHTAVLFIYFTWSAAAIYTTIGAVAHGTLFCMWIRKKNLIHIKVIDPELVCLVISMVLVTLIHG